MRAAAFASLVAVLAATVAARADEPPSGEPAPTHIEGVTAPPPSDPPESIDETATALVDETVIDEERAPAAPPEEPFCVSCVLVGVGAVMLIGTIPLAAQLEAAIRRRDRMRAWVRQMGGPGGDLGFVGGYGIAKANEDEIEYGVATGIVGGVGVIVLGIGVGIVVAEGGFLKGPSERAGSRRGVAWSIAPVVTSEGGFLGVELAL